MTKFIDSEGARFLLVGGVNTALTQLLYMGLLFAMPYAASYTISYVAGIALAYYLSSRFVFHQPLEWSKALKFPLVYLVQYVLGVALLFVMIEWLGLHEMIAPLPVIALLLPITFLMSRSIIKQPRSTEKAP